jgi:hypothetical protein
MHWSINPCQSQNALAGEVGEVGESFPSHANKHYVLGVLLELLRATDNCDEVDR